MNHLRQLRTMTEADMITLMPESDISGVSARMHCLIDELPEDFFESEIRNGWFKATTICRDGIALYRVIWQRVRAGKVLSVLVALEMKPGGDDANYLAAGLEKIARLEGCSTIIFQTPRRALVAVAKNWGAEVYAVCLRKKLS